MGGVSVRDSLQSGSCRTATRARSNPQRVSPIKKIRYKNMQDKEVASVQMFQLQGPVLAIPRPLILLLVAGILGAINYIEKTTTWVLNGNFDFQHFFAILWLSCDQAGVNGGVKSLPNPKSLATFSYASARFEPRQW